MKQTKHKIYVQNVHHSRDHMHSNDYDTAQSLMVSVAVSSLVSFHGGVRHETQATKAITYTYMLNS